MIYECDGFSAGDIIRIRDYEDMRREFGGYAGHTICCPRYHINFPSEMRKYCGKMYHIIGFDSDNNNMVIFEESHSTRDSLDGNWFISTDMIELVSKSTLKIHKKPKNTMECANCGNVIRKSQLSKTATGTYICSECACIKSYSTQNNIKLHKPNKSNKTYGFELECVPIDESHKNAIINSKYGLLPTRDSSLPPHGVEFKTPTYNSLTGLRTLFKTFNKHVKFSSQKCGQHINIGDTKYINSDTIKIIRAYAPQIFTPLYNYMVAHQSDTKRVCGRTFNHFADLNSYSEHCSWINFTHNNRIEFRLSKFKTPDQYFELTCMWTEMIDEVIKDFLQFKGDNSLYYIESSEMFIRAKTTEEKIIKIFQKYATHNANCQKRMH